MPYNTWNTGYPYTPTPAYNAYMPQFAAQPAQIQPQQPMQSQQPVQNGGFVRVQNENEARGYPVAPGNSITFIDKNNPYCYVKTMGFSQLDAPRFERYRLVKEEITEEAVQQTVQNAVTAQPSQEMVLIEALRGQFDDLRAEVEKIKGEIGKPLEGNSARSTRGKKKEEEADG